MYTLNCNNTDFKPVINNKRGQSLMLTLMVMFVLVFLGMVFITLMGRSITNTRRSADTLTTDYLADAGIRYASDQLSYGSELADWRPMPEFFETLKYAYPKIESGASVADIDSWLKTQVIALEAVTETHDEGVRLNNELIALAKDPDRQWLLQGYCRFNYGKGRFLLKVSYVPRLDDPSSRFIKVESIGRMGQIETDDPTTLLKVQFTGKHSYKVAYKAIGITDYSRFITNKDRRSDDFALGTPGYVRGVNGESTAEAYVTQFGEDAATDQPIEKGTRIRCNGNLVWNGVNHVFMNPAYGDGVEVAGDIKYNVLPYTSLSLSNGVVYPTSPATTVTSNLPYVYVGIKGKSYARAYDSGAQASGVNVFNSAPAGVSSAAPEADTSQQYSIGYYRDGRPDPDINKYPRGVTRLDPPLIDASEISDGLNAYRNMTRNSGIWKQQTDTGTWYNTGEREHGDGLYINNAADIQEENNIYAQRGDWTQPGKSKWWNGPYYAPPGVSIELTPFNLDGKPDADGIVGPEIIISHAAGANQAEFTWHDENGKPITIEGERIIMPYPKNGVIFAEGNIRIKGTLGFGKNLTVVSGGTIYVEGNILKCPFGADGKMLNEDSARTSSIALLAKNNVCVNTTQFFGPSQDTVMASTGSDYFDISTERAFWISFSFGSCKIQDPAYPTDPTKSLAKYVDTSGNPVPYSLYLRDSNDPSKAGLTYINMLVNYWTSTDLSKNPFYSLYNFPLNGVYSDEDTSTQTAIDNTRKFFTHTLGDVSSGESGSWRNEVYDLWWSERDMGATSGEEIGKEVGEPSSKPWWKFFRQPGYENRIGFQLDHNFTTATQGNLNYRLARAAVQPCDIRIEALMYAQNGSFFVIPGEWFNPDSSDTEANYTASGKRPAGVDDRYPFYGQPLDVKITIFGAVAENVPASVGDVSAWMEKWGWIPPYHGTPETNWASPAHPDRITVGYRNPMNPELSSVSVLENSTSNRTILQQGLTYIYDRQLSCPRIDPKTYTSDALRRDSASRMLPITPKLPVSPQTIYVGEPM